MIDVDIPRLVRAVIQVESNGNGKAVSPRGAKGLCQLMDITGREWFERLKLPGEYDPFNDEQNVEIGTAVLKWLVGHFQNLELALAAYNWGIGHVSRTMRKRNIRQWATLSYYAPLETRNYVTKVVNLYETEAPKVA